MAYIPYDCLAKLQDLLKKLTTEENTSRPYRRNVAHTVRKDILPLLLHLKDDAKKCTKIIDTIVKILVSVTVPVEYLFAEDDRRTIVELNKLLSRCKEVFTGARHTKAVMDHIKFIVESDLEMNVEYCDSINNCLLLLRNILHVPEVKLQNSTGYSSMQNQIIWNLFTQSIDKVIIYLISCPQRAYWSVTVVQLIALLYKDQHVGTLQKLLNLWLETSLSDSSDDNESNTSPPEREDSSPPITSDPTSDSSDGGGVKRKKIFLGILRSQSTETSSGVSTAHTSFDSTGRKDCPSSQSEDFGYVTQMENQESISTSSNEDDQPQQKPVHQKPHSKGRYSSGKSRTTLDNKELRRKKLVKRSKTSTINMKGLLHHLPTDEDIANILKEFTVDFLLKGYSTLIHDLHSHLLSSTHVQIDTSHFFWLVTFFLKFATQLELDLEHVSSALSQDIFSFLVFQGVWIYEELETCVKIPNIDLKPCLRRLHLVVTAIRECLQAVEAYQKMIHLSEEDRKSLSKLQQYITQIDDLRNLFLLLLRQYNTSMESKQYLQDLILTNHHYLLVLDKGTKESGSFDMIEHLKQFATVEIMRQYGILLESFKENGEFVNNCIFTMMHHIAGDVQQVSTLFQPSILKTFSLIWETDYEICDDWSDLIEYIIHKFTDSQRSEASVNNDQKITETNHHFPPDTTKYDVQHKTQVAIIRDLLEKSNISDKCGNVEKIREQPELKGVSKQGTEEDTVDDGVKILREYLWKDNKGKFVSWLQKILIDTCYAKLVLTNPVEFTDGALGTPVIYHYALLNMPIPVVPWTTEQTAILKYQSFVLLLHKLGFYLPVDTGKVFVTIPNFWNAEHVFGVAQQLGPIDLDKLNFDTAIFTNVDKHNKFEKQVPDFTSCCQRKFRMNDTECTPTMVRYTPFAHPLSITIPGFEDVACGLPPPELSIVENHVIHRNMGCDEDEHNSTCETASIASDLTRMCVSDEEDKLILIVEKK